MKPKKTSLTKFVHGFEVIQYTDGTWKVWNGKKRFYSYPAVVSHIERTYDWAGRTSKNRKIS